MTTQAELSPSVLGPWTDAHCHLADPRLNDQLDDIVSRSRAAGVNAWVLGGVCPADWERQRQLRARLGDGVKLAFGLHPWWVSSATDEEIDDALQSLASAMPQSSMLGELGLDLHPRRVVAAGAAQRQLRAFVAQLDLAQRLPRPLVMHIVRAHDLAIEHLQRYAPFSLGGLVHAFAGTFNEARRYVELGFHLSVGGALVDRPKRARALAPIPASSILIETDAPDQAPRSWNVAHNEPAFLPRIADALAPVWDLNGRQLLDQSHRSLHNLLQP